MKLLRDKKKKTKSKMDARKTSPVVWPSLYATMAKIARGDIVVRMRMALATPRGCCLRAFTLVLANRKLNVVRTPCTVVRQNFHVS